MYSMDDLHQINAQLEPLKSLADREVKAIRGLTGQLYTPHIDAYNDVAIKKADILAHLKSNGELPFSEVERITEQLSALHKRAKNRQIVEYINEKYECRFAAIKLSKSGKIVRKWAKYWLKQESDGSTDKAWEDQVHEIWPSYFVIRTLDL